MRRFPRVPIPESPQDIFPGIFRAAIPIANAAEPLSGTLTFTDEPPTGTEANRAYQAVYVKPDQVREFIRAERVDLGFNFSELARRSAVHPRTPARVERGQRYPDVDTFAALSHGLGWGAVYLVFSDRQEGNPRRNLPLVAARINNYPEVVGQLLAHRVIASGEFQQDVAASAELSQSFYIRLMNADLSARLPYIVQAFSPPEINMDVGLCVIYSPSNPPFDFQRSDGSFQPPPSPNQP